MKTRIKLHLIIYIAIALASFASCENEIPYHPGAKEPQLIMNALLDAGETENYVYLHLSRGYSFEQFGEATLTLSVNGQAETVEAISPEEYYKNVKDKFDEELFKQIVENMRFKPFRLTTDLHPGDHIRLEATGENGKYRASAEVTVPQPIESLHVDTCTTYLYEYNRAYPYRQYKVTLQDRPGEKNHYRLDIWNDLTFRCQWYDYQESGDRVLIDTLVTINREKEIINREDVILTDGHPGTYDDEDNELFPTISNKYNIFTDNTFRNSQATLLVYTPLYRDKRPSIACRYLYRKQTITVRLLSLTEAEYRYLKALNCLEDGDYDETLMEPVCLPSNVEGGLGFVGACSEAKVTIEIPEVKIW